MRIGKSLSSAVLLGLAACAVNPATGRREFMLVTEGQEIQMGREADPQVSASYGLVDDPELQRYVSDLGLRLAALSERPELPWSFKVVDDPIVNAFALPGGFIYVTRGILANFDSEAELAGVLGHEIGHVTARHSASQMSQQQLQQVLLVGGVVLSEKFREYVAPAAMAALPLLNMSFSRGDESQSDELGLRYISSAGYDADAMIGVFQMLAQAGGGGEGRLPEWQLTHPYPENREANIRDVIAETGVSRDGLVNRDVYLNQLDGMMYGPNPREGYFEGARFLHPDLAFEMTFPAGWQTVNQRTVVAGIAPNEDGVVALGVVDGGADPAAELRDFLRGEGITGGATSERNQGGVRVVRAPFEATSETGSLRGEVAFLSHNGMTLRILGYSDPAGWASYGPMIGSTISSFAQVTDARVLDVQPQRLGIVTISSAMSLNSWIQQNRQPVDVETLARLNRVSPGSVLSAGTRIKVVVGQPVG